jgi:hypothetical protein
MEALVKKQFELVSNLIKKESKKFRENIMLETIDYLLSRTSSTYKENYKGHLVNLSDNEQVFLVNVMKNCKNFKIILKSENNIDDYTRRKVAENFLLLYNQCEKKYLEIEPLDNILRKEYADKYLIPFMLVYEYLEEISNNEIIIDNKYGLTDLEEEQDFLLKTIKEEKIKEIARPMLERFELYYEYLGKKHTTGQKDEWDKDEWDDEDDEDEEEDEEENDEEDEWDEDENEEENDEEVEDEEENGDEDEWDILKRKINNIVRQELKYLNGTRIKNTLEQLPIVYKKIQGVKLKTKVVLDSYDQCEYYEEIEDQKNLINSTIHYLDTFTDILENIDLNDYESILYYSDHIWIISGTFLNYYYLRLQEISDYYIEMEAESNDSIIKNVIIEIIISELVPLAYTGRWILKVSERSSFDIF